MKSPHANPKQEPDTAFSSVGTQQIPDARWVGESEFTLTIDAATSKAYLERSHTEDSWDGDAEFILRINGNAFTTERS